MKAMPPAFTAAFDGIEPQTGALAYAGQGAAILGRATLGDGAWLGARSVIRADGNFIDIGAGFHLGAHGTVHITHDFYPTDIGDDVVAGDDSVIHACTIGDGCVIGAGAIILDGAVIGDHACLETGAIVFPRAKLEGGWRYAGSPAKPVAKIDPADFPRRGSSVGSARAIKRASGMAAFLMRARAKSRSAPALIFRTIRSCRQGQARSSSARMSPSVTM